MELVAPFEERIGKPGEPSAVRSRLGWAVYGPCQHIEAGVSYSPTEHVAVGAHFVGTIALKLKNMSISERSIRNDTAKSRVRFTPTASRRQRSFVQPNSLIATSQACDTIECRQTSNAFYDRRKLNEVVDSRKVQTHRHRRYRTAGIESKESTSTHTQ